MNLKAFFLAIAMFLTTYSKNEFDDYEYLEETIQENENPELINRGPDSAPSKRLARIISSYKKILHGSMLAQEIGLMRLREKCSHFNDWIEKLEGI